MHRKLFSTCFAFGVLAFFNQINAHEWHDASSSFSRQAEFVSHHDGRVWMQLPSGRPTSIAWEQLSQQDRDYVRRLEETPDRADPFQDGAAPASSSTPVTPVAMKVTAAAQHFADTGAIPDSPECPDERCSKAVKSLICGTQHFCKYVYFACHGTFHLFDSCHSGFGTAHYAVCAPDCDGCVHCCWYLAFLCKIEENDHYIIYRSYDGNPCIDKWAFAKCPTCCDCRYAVYYHIVGEPSCYYHCFGCADRVCPH
jgi:hypothetical protein